MKFLVPVFFLFFSSLAPAATITAADARVALEFFKNNLCDAKVSAIVCEHIDTSFVDARLKEPGSPVFRLNGFEIAKAYEQTRYLTKPLDRTRLVKTYKGIIENTKNWARFNNVACAAAGGLCVAIAGFGGAAAPPLALTAIFACGASIAACNEIKDLVLERAAAALAALEKCAPEDQECAFEVMSIYYPEVVVPEPTPKENTGGDGRGHPSSPANSNPGPATIDTDPFLPTFNLDAFASEGGVNGRASDIKFKEDCKANPKKTGCDKNIPDKEK